MILIILIICWHKAIAQNNQEKVIDPDYRREVRSAELFADSLSRKQHIPALSVSVGTKDQIVWAEAFGYADLENNVKADIRSRFRLGSVSKCLTSLAVGKLYEDGLLDLDAPVQHYLPDFPVLPYTFTSRQLAGHLAGIRHYTDADTAYCPTKHYSSMSEAIRIFEDDSLLFKPGTSYQYSTYGFSLLGRIIEVTSQMDYLSYMYSKIFLPLAMDHTCADEPDSVIIGRARFYERNKTKWVNAAMVDNSCKWPGAGLLSTPSDLVKMGQGLMNHTLLSKSTVELIFTPQQLSNGKSTGVGIAWRNGTDARGRRFVHHGGLIDGGRTFLIIYPDDGLVVAVMANMSGVNINLDEVTTIASFFFKTHENEKTRN